MIKRLPVVVLAALLLTVWLSGCSTGEKTPAPGESSKIQVAATIYPLADMVRNIGGDRVEVVTLLPAGSSPHTFEMTPDQVKQLSSARIFVNVGAGLDIFADDLVDSSAGADLITLTVTEGMDLLDALDGHNHSQDKSAEDQHHHDEDEDGHEHEGVDHDLHEHGSDAMDAHEEEHHHHHGDKDPHVWLDPVLVKDQIAPQIAAVLAEVSPADAQYFQDNLKAYSEEMDALHGEITARMEPFKQKTFIAFHSAWHYFAQRYELRDVAVEESPGKEPSAQWIARVVDIARDNGTKAILAEPQFSTKAAEVIAAEIGAPVLIVDPLGAQETQGYDSYLGMMRSNLEVLEQALR